MPVNKLFRQRAVDFQLEKVLHTTAPWEYFTEIFGNTKAAGESAKQLAQLCSRVPRRPAGGESDRQAHRFINLVSREDDIGRWAGFVGEEQGRAESVWKAKELLIVPAALKGWSASLDQPSEPERDPILRQVIAALQGVGDALTSGERRNIGLRAFRSMLWRLRGGGGK